MNNTFTAVDSVEAEAARMRAQGLTVLSTEGGCILYYDSKEDENDEREEQVSEDEHPGQYYCGICGWVPLSLFPNCH